MKSLLAVVCLASFAQAQLLEEQVRRPLPLDIPGLEVPLLADFDGDGRLDLVLGDVLAADALFLGRGDGFFDERPRSELPASAQSTFNSRGGDFDGDGDTDFVSVGSSFELFLNDGAGRFSRESALRLGGFDRSSFQSCAVLDVDRDGDLDIFCVDTRSSLLLLNDGRGFFAQGRDVAVHTGTRSFVWTEDVLEADLDGDGIEDVLLFGMGEILLFLGDGQGGFTEATLPGLPADQTAFQVGAGDIDADGDVDLLLPDHRIDPRFGTKLLRNDGSAGFTDVTTQQLPGASESFAAVLEDLDLDGDIDALLAGRDAIRVFHNDGTGRFTERVTDPAPGQGLSTVGMALGDLNGDGYPDVLGAHTLPGGLSRSIGVYLSQEGSSLVWMNAPGLANRLSAIAEVHPADVDRDGAVDLFLATEGHSGSLLFRNGQDARFDDITGASFSLGDLDDLRSVFASGDLDGDGDVDLLGVSSAGDFRSFLNDGVGRFTATTFSGQGTPLAMELSDLDRDGVLDLVCGYGGIDAFLFTGLGGGAFAAPKPLPTSPAAHIESITVFDFDQDGFEDLLLGGSISQAGVSSAYLFRNDQQGFFIAAQGLLPTSTDNVRDVAVADTDSDGDLDLLLATDTGLRHWRNEPAGFGDVTGSTIIGPNSSMLSAIDVGDLDEDGRLEIALESRQTRDENVLTVFSEVEPGKFSDHSARFVDAEIDRGRRLAMLDVDQDEDLDLVTNRVLLNTTVQSFAPQVAEIGRSYVIEHRAEAPGRYDRVATILAPRLAGQRISVPGVRGSFALDPAAFLRLPVIAIPAASPGRLEIPVPNLQPLRGLKFYTQGLFAGPGGVRWGNVIEDAIL